MRSVHGNFILGVLVTLVCSTPLAVADERAENPDLSAEASAKADALELLEAGHRRVFQKVCPAVVGLDAWIDREQAFYGTGVLIGPDGVLLTSTTVVPPGTTEIKVHFSDGRVVTGQMLGTYEELETAVVKVSGSNYSYLEFGDSAGVELGQTAYTFGNPFHSISTDGQVCMSAGTVSGVYHVKSADDQSTYRGIVIETDAAVNPGADGGPLVDHHGKLLGILSLSFSESRWLGTAVPAHLIGPIVEELREGRGAPIATSGSREESSGYLGATFEQDDAGRVRAAGVARGGPAWKAGLRPGDRVAKLDGTPLGTLEDLEKKLEQLPAGTKILLRIWRSEEVEELEIELGRRPT